MGEAGIPSRSTWAVLGSSVLLIAALAAALLSTGGSAGASSNSSFRAFASCSAFGIDPDRTCYVGDGFVAVFLSKKKDRVPYTLCVTNKGTGAKSCFSKKTRKAYEPSMISIWRKDISEDPGSYKLKWRVKGRGIVATAKLRVRISI